MKKFRDVLSRWECKELSAMEAGEILGCSERELAAVSALPAAQQEEGLDGLADRRLGKASDKRVPVDEIARILDRYRSDYLVWTVKHFHEQLQK